MKITNIQTEIVNSVRVSSHTTWVVFVHSTALAGPNVQNDDDILIYPMASFDLQKSELSENNR